jgi:hypothetical protein
MYTVGRCLALLVVGILLGGSVLEWAGVSQAEGWLTQAEARSPLSRYRRFRYRRRWGKKRRKRKKRKSLNLPALQLKLERLRVSGRIDQSKLKEAIEQKMKRMTYCYKLVVLRKKKQTKSAGKARPKQKEKKLLGRIALSLKLNEFGRAIDTRVGKTTLSASEQDCFVWYTRGRKFFPPEGNKTIKLQLSLAILTGNAPVKTKKGRKPPKR